MYTFTSSRQRLRFEISCIILMHQFLFRTSGNLCVSFSSMTCNDISSTPSSMETPQVTIFTRKQHRTSSRYDRFAIILGVTGGALLSLLLVSLLIFFYVSKKKRTTIDATHSESTYKKQNY